MNFIAVGLLVVLLSIVSPNVGSAGVKLKPRSSMNNTTVCEVTLRVESWLVGVPVGPNRLSTFFNVSNDEFNEYLDLNDITSIHIDYFWRNVNETTIESLQSIDLNDLGSSFQASTWSQMIDPVDFANGVCLASVILNGMQCGELIEIPLEEDETVDPVVLYPDGLPVLECGGEVRPPSNSTRPLDVSLGAGDIVNVGGFPILVETAGGNEGIYSGTGRIALPFNQAFVQVEFTSVLINDEREIYQGTVYAVEGDLSENDYLNLDTGPLNIGGDICIVQQDSPGTDVNGYDINTGLDSWGFDSTGYNPSTMSFYDENGFNQAGEHISGGQYNDCGCDRNGMSNDTPPQPCAPNCGPNEQASTFADSLRASLPAQVDVQITQITQDLEAEIAALNCNQYRTEMDTYIDRLGYDDNLIKGEGGMFFDPSMHLKFMKKPITQLTTSTRNPDARSLDEAHVSLYSCDRQEYALNSILSIIATNTINRTELAEEIIGAIRSWTDYQYGLYHDDPVKFGEWLHNFILNKLQRETQLDGSYFAINDVNIELIRQANNSINNIFNISQSQAYFSSASIDNPEISKERLNDAQLAEAKFLFDQGSIFINGVHRAFYLEQIAEYSSQEFPPGSNGTGTLPVEIKKEVAGRDYTVYLDNMSFTPSGASTNAYIIITDPESNRRFAFHSSGISFGPSGLESEARLSLATDVEIRLNNAAMLVLQGNDSTYVAWDCYGFKSLGLDGQIEFCRDFITPLDNNFEPLPDTVRYRLDFAIQEVTSWLEFELSVSAPPFAITQYPDVKWSLTNMFLDLSSSSTPQFKPMEGYSSPFWNDTTMVMAPEWKGFYLDTLSARFPNQFSNNSSEIVADAYEILIDGSGFTGGVSVGISDTINPDPLVSIEDGSIGGWAFSVDKFELRVLKNHFAGAGMAGDINVPIFEDNFKYEASIFPGSIYEFAVSPLDELRADMLLANVSIDSSSSISITYQDGQFHANASLNGKMDIVGDGINSNGLKFTFPSLTFQNLIISNQAPYFQSGVWGMEDSLSLSLSGFALSLSNLHSYKPQVEESSEETYGGLGLDIALKLSAGIEVTAVGKMGIVGKLTHVNDCQRWIKERVEMNSLSVGGNIPGVVNIEGGLEWFKTGGAYGEGFRGLLDVQYDKLAGVGLRAIGQFGKVENANGEEYKYFYVDALAKLGALSPTIGPVTLRGFGGGVSNNMTIDQGSVQVIDDTPGELILPPIGSSLSSTTYTPDENAGISLKAAVVIATLKEEIFNGTVSVSAVFNDGGGLNNFILEGSGQFLKGIDYDILPEKAMPVSESDTIFTPPLSVSAQLKGYIYLDFNFAAKSFDGQIKVFLDSPGSILRGARANGELVDAQAHFSTKGWFFHMGTPDDRCGIKVVLPDDILSANATAYFSAGTMDIPSIGDVHPKARAIASSYKQNQSLRIPGAGLIFGASLGIELNVGTPSLIGIKFDGGVGFDVMLRKYEGLTCAGETDPIGLDGWYAIGQMWAYADIKASLFGFSAAEIGLATILEARMPNPFYGEGHVSARIKILGFIKKTVHFNFKLGNDCILQSTLPDDDLGIEVVTNIDPIDGSKEVSLNKKLSASLAHDFDDEIKIGANNFKVEVTEVKMLNKYGYEENIYYNLKYDDQKINIYHSDRLLPGDDSLTIIVTSRITNHGNFYADQVKQVSFTTGPTLKHIPSFNIEDMYPIDGMTNYYKDMAIRSPVDGAFNGFVKLYAPQLALLSPEDENQRLGYRITDHSGTVTEGPLDYNIFEKTLSYVIDPDLLENETFYTVELIKFTSSGPKVADINIYGPSSQDNIVQAQDQEDILHTIRFRTSAFNTLEEKFAAIFDDVDAGFLVSRDLTLVEPFDKVEIEGNGQFEPLLSFKSEYSQNIRIDYEYILPDEITNDLFIDAFNNIRVGDSLLQAINEYKLALIVDAVEVVSIPYNDLFVDEEQIKDDLIQSVIVEQNLEGLFFSIMGDLREIIALYMYNEMERIYALYPEEPAYADARLSIDEIDELLKIMYPDLDLSEVQSGNPSRIKGSGSEGSSQLRFARDTRPRVKIQYYKAAFVLNYVFDLN